MRKVAKPARHTQHPPAAKGATRCSGKASGSTTRSKPAPRQGSTAGEHKADRSKPACEGAQQSLALVDNCFFVLQKLLQRAGHCCDGYIAEAAVAAAAELLMRPLLETLGRALKQTVAGKLTDKLAATALAGVCGVGGDEYDSGCLKTGTLESNCRRRSVLERGPTFHVIAKIFL